MSRSGRAVTALLGLVSYGSPIWVFVLVAAATAALTVAAMLLRTSWPAKGRRDPGGGP